LDLVQYQDQTASLEQVIEHARIQASQFEYKRVGDRERRNQQHQAGLSPIPQWRMHKKKEDQKDNSRFPPGTEGNCDY
jgi:hypothetical protein